MGCVFYASRFTLENESMKINKKVEDEKTEDRGAFSKVDPKHKNPVARLHYARVHKFIT